MQEATKHVLKSRRDLMPEYRAPIARISAELHARGGKELRKVISHALPAYLPREMLEFLLAI